MQTTTDNLVREMVQKRHRRRRALLVSFTGGGVIVAAVVGAGLVQAGKPDVGEPPTQVPAGATSDKAGLALSTGAVRVDLYLDYLCPACRDVEPALTAELDGLTESGDVSVHFHPVAFLDNYSNPGGYSTRAASAAACAADEGRFEQYSTALFARQPPERGPGLSAADLVDVGREAGISGVRFASCVEDGPYVPWVEYVSEAAASRDVASTPTVMVDGRRVDVTGSDPAAALAHAVSEAG